MPLAFDQIVSKPPAESIPDRTTNQGNKATFQNIITDLNKCFRKNGLESDKDARALDYVTEFLAFIKTYRPDNLKPKFPPSLEKLDDGGRHGTDVLRIHYKFDQIRMKVREYRRKIEKIEDGDKMHFLDYFVIAESLDELESLVLAAEKQYINKNAEISRQASNTHSCIVKCRKKLEMKIKTASNIISSVQESSDVDRKISPPITTTNPLKRSNGNAEQDPNQYAGTCMEQEQRQPEKVEMAQKEEKPETAEEGEEQQPENPNIITDEILDMSGHFKNDDLKTNKDKMPKDEYMALVRSRAEKFEPQITEAESFDFMSYFIIEENLKQFIYFLDMTQTKDSKELTDQKAENIIYIKELQEKLDAKRSD